MAHPIPYYSTLVILFVSVLWALIFATLAYVKPKTIIKISDEGLGLGPKSSTLLVAFAYVGTTVFMVNAFMHIGSWFLDDQDTVNFWSLMIGFGSGLLLFRSIIQFAHLIEAAKIGMVLNDAREVAANGNRAQIDRFQKELHKALITIETKPGDDISLQWEIQQAVNTYFSKWLAKNPFDSSKLK